MKVEIKELVTKRGFTSWIEVLCPADVTSSIVAEIQDALRIREYYEGSSSIIDEETKSGLVMFQEDNGLPIGNLDFKTLATLNIDY